MMVLTSSCLESFVDNFIFGCTICFCGIIWTCSRFLATSSKDSFFFRPERPRGYFKSFYLFVGFFLAISSEIGP